MFAPYIGITDFMTREEALRSADHFAVHAQGIAHPPRKLMVGVMMSRKTLHGIPTKWSSAFPKNDEVAEIFTEHPHVFNTLHYADYEGIDVLKSLRMARDFSGERLHAIQLDMIWPDPRVIRLCHHAWPDVHFILQINTSALQAVSENALLLVDRIREYGDDVHGVLFDRSMGRGLGMEPFSLLPFMSATHEAFPGLRIAVAGGLGPNSLDSLKLLVPQFGGLSWDAQSRLRYSGSALHPIDWDLAHEYIERSCALLHDAKFSHHP